MKIARRFRDVVHRATAAAERERKQTLARLRDPAPPSARAGNNNGFFAKKRASASGDPAVDTGVQSEADAAPAMTVLAWFAGPCPACGAVLDAEHCCRPSVPDDD